MNTSFRGDWRAVVGVVSGGHLLSHFYQLTLPPLFPLLREEFALNNAELGLLVSVLMIGGLLQAPVGNVVDRIGAKWVLVVGIGGTAAGIFLMGFGQSYPILLAMAVLSGVGQTAFHPADYALIETVTDADVQGRAFSVHTFSGYVGFAAAPVVVGTLGFAVGWRETLFVVGAVGLVYAAVSAVALDPAYRTRIRANDEPATSDTEANRPFLSALRRPGIVAMIGFFLLTAFAAKTIQSFTPVLAIDSFGLGESVGNTLLTAYFVFGAAGVLSGGVFADRYPPSRIIAGSLMVGSTILLVLVTGVIPTTTLSLVGSFGLAGFFISLILPSRDRLVSGLSRSGTMGQSFGIVFTGGAVGALIGPVALGAVADASTVAVSFVLAGVMYLIAGGLAFSIGRGWLVRDPGVAPSGGD